MEPGISTWTMGINQLDALKKIKEAGFRWIELWPYPFNFLISKIREISEAISSLDLKAWSLHAPFEKLDIASPEELLRRKSVKAIIESIKMASILECKYVIVHPSRGGYTADMHRHVLKSFIKSMREISREANKYGVHIALENMLAPRNPHVTRIGVLVKEMRLLIELLNEHEILICLDTGHSNYNGIDPSTEVLEANNLLGTLHVNDNDGTADQHKIPGEGTINWQLFIRALNQVNYNGIFMMEIYGANNPEVTLRRSFESFVRIARSF